MKRLSVSKLKLVVVSILVLFVLQEVAIHKFISEPYPALRMPPFYGNGLNAEGFYEKVSVDIKIDFENASPLELPPRRFFYDAPTSHIWDLLNNFKPAGKAKRSPSLGRLSFLKPILPGFFVSRNRTLDMIQHDPETLQWLRNQIREISPDKTPTKISFYWYKDQFNTDNLMNRQRELTGSTSIGL